MSDRPTSIVLNLGPIGPNECGRVVHHYRDAKQCAEAWTRAVAALEEPPAPRRRLPETGRTRKPKETAAPPPATT